uniref:Uncharacterized protein n=1 Tax=Lotus japonicus TaxID=34305 RepID=I3SJU6_LOTJA|nr:unknown [Lotus japonicus]
MEESECDGKWMDLQGKF